MAQILFFVLNALWWIIIIDSVLSWVMPPDKIPRSLTTQITDPLYAPFRSVLKPERMGGFDFSPLIVLFIIWLARELLERRVYGG
jgi:YggT family protein